MHTFTDFIPLSEGTISEDTFKDKDIVLGQYFRVVSEAQTANGARAALVWHTNGRSSLRFAGSGGSEEGGNATETLLGETSAVKKISKNSSASTLRSII